ncbi:MAG: hypothetical protein LUQ17_00825 [Methanomicrobiales archaeon]|nr:hypothetical protein [Methanomicrobiales archaeon]
MKETSAEIRWQIASKSASSLPVLYTIILRDYFGEESDRIAEEVWCHAGSGVSELATGLDLATDPADRLASGLLEILQTLFGTEFRGEILDLSSDRAVLLINRCPFLLRSVEFGRPTPAIFHPCMAFCVSATETLNGDYSVRFIRAMCMGDKNCELRVASKEYLDKCS